MTVLEMCTQAANLSNRGDEYAMNDEGTAYEDESLLWRTIFLAAINDAYHEASRRLGIPSYEDTVTPEEDGTIDISALTNPVGRITRVMNSDKSSEVEFRLVNRNEIRVLTDDDVVIQYTYLPDRLEADGDEPEFPDEAVPAELYIFLAAARVYQSENKHKSAGPWLQEYYAKLSKIRHIASGTARRIPSRRFR